MLKVECKLDRSKIRIVENILYEISPTNWVIITNRNTKESKLQGSFIDKNVATEEINKLQNLLGENLPISSETNLEDDWKETYKLHFKPWHYKNFKFVPSWEKEISDVESSNLIISIDPGMAFGTGTHETTRLCLEFLIDQYSFQREVSPKSSLIDIGCGSGILAITAAKLGFKKILGIDNDYDAIENALLNSKKNCLSDSITFKQIELAKVTNSHYQCVIANIQADVLLLNSSVIINLLRYQNSSLILSGILNYEVEHVIKAYQKDLTSHGLNCKVVEKSLGEWSALLFLIN
ncbi:MAG: 50S ribosomal protein L11 methyltransferase [Opitutales bacterium]|nr:50S ribosomal protein L11 methyltransferase [Opitutales bacterium]